MKMTQLEFMVGRWQSTSGKTTTEETWSPLQGGSMMGHQRMTTEDETTSFEFMRIAQSKAAVQYTAWPSGGSPTAFALIKVDGKTALFENPEHDFPKRIQYSRHGDVLTAKIWGTHPDKAKAWSWTLAGSEDASETPRATGVGGVFFKSKDPKALREWYGEHLGLVINEYGSVFEFRTAHQPGHTGYLSWSPFADTTTYFQPSDCEFMINYRVFHLDLLMANLAEKGIQQVGDIQRTEYGDFAHILDLEGNKVELWEPVDAVFERLYDGKTTK